MHRWDPKLLKPPSLVRPVPVDPTGQSGPTRGSAKRSLWRQTSLGYYVPSSVSDDLPEQRALEQSLRLTQGAVTGWASLRLHGAQFFDGLAADGRTRLPVPLAAGTDRLRPSDAAWITRARLGAADVVVRHGIRCVRPDLALLHELRRLVDLRSQVVAIDMTIAAELTTLDRLRSHCSRLRGGSAHLPAIALAAEDSRAPTETRLRLIWELDARWPRPQGNRPIFDLEGHLLGTPDLLDPHLGIIGEYDGAEHRTRQRHTQDVRRESDFRRVGLEYVAVVGMDLHQSNRIVARMEAARSRARQDSSKWTLVPPRWFTPPRPLAQRVAARELWLRRTAS